MIRATSLEIWTSKNRTPEKRPGGWIWEAQCPIRKFAILPATPSSSLCPPVAGKFGRLTLSGHGTARHCSFATVLSSKTILSGAVWGTGGGTFMAGIYHPSAVGRRGSKQKAENPTHKLALTNAKTLSAASLEALPFCDKKSRAELAVLEGLG